MAAFCTDVQKAEATCAPGQEAAAAMTMTTLRVLGRGRSTAVVPEHCDASALQPSLSLLNITAPPHSAAQQSVTFHLLQTVKMEAGKMPKHLFVCSFQKKSILFLYLFLIQNSRQTPFGPSDPKLASAHSWNF